MYQARFWLYQLVYFVAMVIAITGTSLRAQTAPSFSPPSTVTLWMYELDRDHGGENTFKPCTKGNTSYGCTADSNRTYPFNSSTITIGIDDTSGADNAQYSYPYLWDVVTTELGVHLPGDSSLPDNGYVPDAAITAQAIAARTYTYHRVFYVGAIDNSVTYHAYLPYSYAVLLDSNQQEDVRRGAQSRFYLTESNTSYPIDALYGADNGAQTSTGNPTLVSPINYLQSVADPISAWEGVQRGTGGGGMSSNGARRWSYGHQVAQPGAERADRFWSVRWTSANQILTHYYSGVHLRDAFNPSATVSQIPAYRWVPLRIVAPTSTCANANVPVELWLQNTGTAEWAANTIISVITNLTATPAAVTTPQANEIPTAVPVGDTVVITRTVRPTFAGVFTYSVDFYTADVGFFSRQTPAWPRDEQFTLEAVDCHAHLYLPVVQNSHVTSAQAQNNNQAATAVPLHPLWLPFILR